jgi:diacylglycerol kinase family enzyme
MLAPAPDGAVALDRVAIVINRRAGTVRRLGAAKVQATFSDALGDALTGIYAGTGKDMEANLRRALADGARIVLPIGGDGTCTAVAERARAEGFLASALPGGTKNILAKRLWGDTDLLEIAALLKSGRVAIRHMDAGEANGRLFFVGASFGMIPHLARARERLRGRAEPSGLWAALRHVARLGRGLFSLKVLYTVPERPPARCAALMVSVKSIDEMLFRPGEKADPASFDCAAASPEGWWQLTWLALRAIFTDTWRSHTKVADFNAPSLDVSGRNPLVVALDGEGIALVPPVKLVMLQDAVPLLGRARTEESEKAAR